MTTTTALPAWLPEAAGLIANGAKKADIASQFGTTRTNLRALLKTAGLFQKPVADANRAARRAARKAAKADTPAAATADASAPASAPITDQLAQLHQLAENLSAYDMRLLARKHGIKKTVDGKPIGSAAKAAILEAVEMAALTAANA